ncbi:kynureninase [soil metagenome]
MKQFSNTLSFAQQCDQEDVLSSFRQRFHIPKHGNENCIYLCGNSLGLQPKKTAVYVNTELTDWATLGVEGHFKKDTGWFGYHELLRKSTANLVGALPEEVIVMNHLTVNLHLLMVSFYRPDAKRYKIICEGGAFPSDRYALQSQVKWHGFDPKEALIELQPSEGEEIIKHTDILKAIADCGDALALVMLGGVHYFTGQVLDMPAITKAAHEVGAYAGFDLAHATGNLKVELHKWDVDFAAWCSYKYLNGGPGTVGGAFINQKHVQNTALPRFAGWWGNDPALRFKMPHQFVPVASADSWQLSNAPILEMAALRASMELFEEAGIEALTKKSLELTSYLLFVIKEVLAEKGKQDLVKIITPFEKQQQGCQLSLQFQENGKAIFDELTAAGVIADWREPDQAGRGSGVIRVAPVPLYNSFEDCFRFGELLSKAIS